MTVLDYNNTTDSTPCYRYDAVKSLFFTFDTYQLVRVVVTWTFCVLGIGGNVFVLCAIKRWKESNHFLMVNLAYADLFYACSVLPLDGVWNWTMQWYAGNQLCKFLQMAKQFGMYSSAFMILVISLDRAITISCSDKPKPGRTRLMAAAGWLSSAICAIPATVVFSTCEVLTCEKITLRQCVDNVAVSQKVLQPYRVFTMTVSFLLPLGVTIASYSVISYQISKMIRKDVELTGKSDQGGWKALSKAKKRTWSIEFVTTLTFLICWGPYYVIGIMHWFLPDDAYTESLLWTGRIAYLMMYLNCILHPIVFGVFMKKVREAFLVCLRYPIKLASKTTVTPPQSNSQPRSPSLEMELINRNNNKLTNDHTKLLQMSEGVC